MSKFKYKNAALVSHPLYTHGGAEYHLSVIQKIFNDSTIFTAWYDHKVSETHFPRSDISSSFLQHLPAKKKYLKELIPLLPYAYRSMRVSGDYDLALVLSDGFEKQIRIDDHVDKVAYILTPPRFLWMEQRSTRSSDRLTYKIYDNYLDNYLHTKWKKEDLASMDKYQLIIANSIDVQKRIANVYGRDSVVVYPPVEVNSIRYNRNPDSREDWFLYFGRVETYKGVELAIRAAVEGGYQLKIAGTGADSLRMMDLVNSLGARHQVGFLGYVSERMKKTLLHKCRALLYPVFDEDFGIVPLEASAAGAPVIAFRGGGVKETVVEGETGIFFDDYNYESLLERMRQFDNMTFSAESCRKQAMKFSRDSFQNKLKNTLDGFSKR